jgi:hypothetical protein
MVGFSCMCMFFVYLLAQYWFLRMKVQHANVSLSSIRHQPSRCTMAVFFSRSAADVYGIWQKEIYSHFINLVSITGIYKLRDHSPFLFIRKVASPDDNQRGYYSNRTWRSIRKGEPSVQTLVGNRKLGEEVLSIDIFMQKVDFFNDKTALNITSNTSLSDRGLTAGPALLQ